MNRKSKLMHMFWPVSLALFALILAACQPSVYQTPTAPAAQAADTMPAATMPVATMAATTAATQASSGGTAVVPATGGTGSSGEVTLAVANDPKLGKILVDGKGMTLYIFTKDGPNQSNCTGKCLQAWPPFKTQGKPAAGDGVDASLISTTNMADGSMIVTYNKMPLYYWASDTKPGDTTGQGVGKVWFVVSPDGKPVGMPASSGAAGSPTAAATTAATVAATAGAASGSSAAASEPVINVATDPKLGKILVDGKGMTLYHFTKDAPDKSNCSANCLKAWPPLLTQGSPTAGAGVDASLLGSTSLADGSKIVTYNKMPLYYWMNDAKPGDATGQGNNSVWFVVSPDGKPVGAPAGSSTGY